MSFSKPKPPKPTSAQKALEGEQLLQAGKLNDAENERRKRLLTAQQGVRAYRGSPLWRAAGGAGSPTTSGRGQGAGAAPSSSYAMADYARSMGGLFR